MTRSKILQLLSNILRRISVGHLFAIIMFVSVVPIGSVSIWLAWSTKKELFEHEHATLSQIAETAAFQYHQMILSVEQKLAFESMILSLVLLDQETCNDMIKRRETIHPFIKNMIVISRDGVVRCASDTQKIGTDLSSLGYFRNALTTDRLVVGKPIIAHPIDRLVVPVTLRIDGMKFWSSESTEQAVISADLELEDFIRQVRIQAGDLQNFGFSQRMVWVVDTRGIVMSDPSSPERRGARAPFWPATGVSGERRIIGTDFEERKFALAISPKLSGGLFIVVGKQISEITTEANRRLAASAAIALAGLAGGLAFAFFVVSFLIVKPLYGLTAASQMLKAGAPDIGMPSVFHVGELEQLRRSFIDMAKVITERERLLRLRNEELKDISSRDSLTGVANRGAFDLYLSEVWAAAAASKKPLSLLFVDIDYFKRYNDAYGHQAGDSALRVIAHALQHLPLRDSDMIARYGGEEFVVVLPNTSLTGAVAVAERAVVAIRNLGIPHDASPKRRVSISIGASSCYPANDKHPDSLIASADAALYRAKAEGRDQVYAENPSSTQNKIPERDFKSTSAVNNQ